MRMNRARALLGAVLATGAMSVVAASDPSLIHGACDAGRQDNPAFTACLAEEMKKLATLVERYSQAAKASLLVSAENSAAQGSAHEARSYRDAAEQVDVAQARWEEFREAHCTAQAKQVNGSGAAAAPDRCKVRLTYERLQQIAKLAPTGLPPPPTVDGRPPPPGPLADRWPVRDLARFVFERLDLATFANSTGPRRPRGQRSTFADLGIRPTSLSETQAISDDGSWMYSVQIVHKGDVNRDGVEEVLVCFREKAGDGGTYRAEDPLVVQLDEGRVVALAYTQEERAAAGGCPGRR